MSGSNDSSAIRHMSKSEILLRLSNPSTRAQTVEWLRHRRRIPVPRSLVPEIDVVSEPQPRADFTTEETLRTSMRCTKQVIERVLKIGIGMNVLEIDDPIERIFYLSVKQRISPSAQNEYDLLVLLERVYSDVMMKANSNLIMKTNSNNLIMKTNSNVTITENNSNNVTITKNNSKAFLKHCHTKFTKESITDFLKSNVCNFKAIKDFLVFLTPKLEANIPEIWFENDFEMIDLRRMNRIQLNPSLKFDRRVFTEMIQYKSFRKAVFDTRMSREFVISMKDFTNRADFDYFYNNAISLASNNPVISTSKNKSINNPVISTSNNKKTVIKPRDFMEYEFFTTHALTKSDIQKIRRYQQRIGHDYILNEFVRNHIDSLIEYADNNTVTGINNEAVTILEHTIIYNESVIDNRSNSFNDELFEKIKYKEDIFRTLAPRFSSPKDPILKDIATQNFRFTVKEAANYINFGYEKELERFFSQKRVEEYKEVIEERNLEFFLRLFSNNSFEDYVTILDIIKNVNKNTVSNINNRIANIYNRLLDIPDKRIFLQIPHPLRIVFVLRHKEFIPEFIATLDEPQATLQDASQIYEAICYESIDCRDGNMNLITNINNRYLSIITNTDMAITQNVIESMFLNSFILRDRAFPLFIEIFNRFIEECVISLSKKEIVSMCDNKGTIGDGWGTSDLSRIQQCYSIINSNTTDPSLVINNNTTDPSLVINSNNLQSMIHFTLNFNLSNKFVTFILFQNILEILLSGSSLQRILLLCYIQPNTLTKEHLLKFIDTVIPLLNNSNITVCELARRKLNQIRVDTVEIQCIIPEITQAFTNKEYFPVFLEALKSIQFNNYLCFNSLNILIQVLVKNLNDYPKECLSGLKGIVNVIKDKDIRQVSGLIFEHVSRFVINNGFYMKEALETASQYCLYVKYEDFEGIINNLRTMRVSRYLVEVMKVKGDRILNDRIINRVLYCDGDRRDGDQSGANQCDGNNSNRSNDNNSNRSTDQSNTHHHTNNHKALGNFIAVASDLPEFSKYLPHFMPFIKDLFTSDKIESRQIATKALKLITNTQSITQFLVDCCIHCDHNVRLQALDILEYLPMIFILRYDSHSLVKKKAVEEWKKRVSNTNKELKGIYKEVLGFVKYKKEKVFGEALKGMIEEMSVKYTTCLEQYVCCDGYCNIPTNTNTNTDNNTSNNTSNNTNNNTDNNTDVREFILSITIKNNRLVPIALEFCTNHHSPNLFKALYNNDYITDKNLPLFLFDRFKDPVYIQIISETDKCNLIRQLDNSIIRSPAVGTVMKYIQSSPQIESLLLSVHPIFSYYYISMERLDCGNLSRIFQRVFKHDGTGVNVNDEETNNTSLDQLITQHNLPYLIDCPLDTVKDKDNLFNVLITQPNRRIFEKVVELIKNGTGKELGRNGLIGVMGYLFRNVLVISRRQECIECISLLFDNNTTAPDNCSVVGYMAVFIKLYTLLANNNTIL